MPEVINTPPDFDNAFEERINRISVGMLRVGKSGTLVLIVVIPVILVVLAVGAGVAFRTNLGAVLPVVFAPLLGVAAGWYGGFIFKVRARGTKKRGQVLRAKVSGEPQDLAAAYCFGFGRRGLMGLFVINQIRRHLPCSMQRCRVTIDGAERECMVYLFQDEALRPDERGDVLLLVKKLPFSITAFPVAINEVDKLA